MDFLKAIRENDYKKVEKKLKKGVDVNRMIPEYDKQGFAFETIPLCVAAARGYTEILELLISYGANIHASNKDWSSPMHTATYHGHLDVMRRLIVRKVNLNNRDQHGDTCLHVAVKRSNNEAVTILINQHIDTEIKNNEGDTAHQIAINFGFTRIAQALRAKEIKVMVRPTPAPKPNIQDKSPNSSETEKERLKRQLQELELKEVNNDIRDKQADIVLVSSEIQDLEETSSSLRKQVATLEKKLKEVQQKLLAKQTFKNSLEEELTVLERKKERQTISELKAPNEQSFECPICFTLPTPPKQVFQCENGHIYCSECKEKPRMNTCPQCRIPLSKNSAIRNIVYEEIVADLFA